MIQATNSATDSNRFVIFTDLPKYPTHPDTGSNDLDILEVEVKYRAKENVLSHAVTMDNLIIPTIIRAVNSMESSEEAIRASWNLIAKLRQQLTLAKRKQFADEINGVEDQLNGALRTCTRKLSVRMSPSPFKRK